MKKTFAIILALVLALAMSVSVCASPGCFVSSPSGNPAPTIIGYEPLSPDCDMELIITAYNNRDTLPDNLRELIEKAYDDIANADDLTDLWDDLAALAKDKNVPGEHLSVSDLFNIRGEGCNDHNDHEGFKVALDANTLENFFALMQQDANGNWSIVPGAYINANGELVFHLKDVPANLAIVVNTQNSSPVTNDSTDIYVYGALMLASALAIVLLVVKSKKYA